MNNFVRVQAMEDFNRARNKALFNEIQHFLNPDRRKLLSFDEVKNLLKPKNEVYLGMQTVPIEKIAGSEGRYLDFDNHFLPRRVNLRQRWERVDEAHLSDIILPPIQLYEIGGLYFVRDGNHRVSVAKAQDVRYIDAEVISLQSEIKLKPGITPETLLTEIIEYEKRNFYAETAFGDLTDDWNLDFTSTGQYDVILAHILEHKYFINEKVETEISFNDALLSWYNNVYHPILMVIKKHRLLRKFRNRTASDLYVWIVKRWDDLKRKYGLEYSLDEATKTINAETKRGFFTKVKDFMKKIFNS
ncbi:transcriptional regulator [Brucepastera parasyntrophica]|uniref:transcriptional regulator n=1 Tax=Brucepastera parasyntrophica TaxID=2880008 RepID=UPI00210DC9C7|nr:transcriptional regulator [Brucepastera parasyntrophica]ULQ60144.1 transcriptional regulator [Brucepastera parasyntrophica]